MSEMLIYYRLKNTGGEFKRLGVSTLEAISIDKQVAEAANDIQEAFVQIEVHLGGSFKDYEYKISFS